MSMPVLLETTQTHLKDYSLILAVNDNRDSLDLLCTVLRDESLNIVTAEDGGSALEMMREIKPDLIISDVMMPGIDGIEFCRRVKNDPATCDIPVLLMTAFSCDEADVLEGLRAGADDYLQSHIPIELLRKKVEYLVAYGKQREMGRVESERDFRSLVENSLDIVSILNQDGTIRYESPSIERVLGYNPIELLGKNALSFVHPLDRPRVVENFRMGIQKESCTEYVEFRCRHKDGSWRLLEAVGKNLLHEPRVRGIIVNSRDISERTQTQEILKRFEERYRSTVDAVKDYAIFMLDLQGNILSWSSGAERIFGYRTDEIVGRHFSCFYNTPDSATDKPQSELEFAMSDGRYEEEGRRLKRDGSEFWASTVVTALRDEGGRLTGFLSVIRDISERRQRDQLQRKTEELLRAILDYSPSLIYVKDTDARYVLVNRKFESVCHVANQDIVGKTSYDIFPKELADSYQANLQRVIESGESLEVEETGYRDEELRHYLSMEFPLNDSNGKIYGVCGVSTDITAHKELEEQFRHTQKMDAIGRLAGGVAHDFNNLLTAIMGYSGLLSPTFDGSDPRRAQIEQITKAGERATALTAQLLAFSRKQVLQPRLLDLNSAIENVSNMLRRLIGEDIELVNKLDPDLTSVMADPGHIDQVLMNLAVNARDAMNRGGILTIETAKVQLDSECAGLHVDVPAGKYAMLAVSDTGCGMDQATKARVFDPFFTTKEQGKGTGLGLSTVYGIVKQSGGHISVTSEVGRGSSFKIYLPLFEERATQTKRRSISNIRPFGSETILLVDDEESVRGIVRIVLESIGYTVIEAESAEDALQQAQLHHEIDLLLTDVGMPQMDGRALAASLTAKRPMMKVLYLSGYADPATLEMGLLGDGMSFLQKPFSPAGLARKVREVLDQDSTHGN